ncbi:MAG: hypothetical protein ABSH49_23350 [Bryobacteraceae bacterium]|jgi:hypothetical protein
MKPIDVKRGAGALHANRIHVLAWPFRLTSDQRSNKSQNKIKEGEHGNKNAIIGGVGGSLYPGFVFPALRKNLTKPPALLGFCGSLFPVLGWLSAVGSPGANADRVLQEPTPRRELAMPTCCDWHLPSALVPATLWDRCSPVSTGDLR